MAERLARRSGVVGMWLALAAGAVVAGCSPLPSDRASADPRPSQSVSANESASPVGSVAHPEGSASLEPSQIYPAIEEQVVAERGLEPTRSIEPTVLDQAGLFALVDRITKERIPPDRLEVGGRLLTHLGLLPADNAWEEDFRELTGAQVDGIYDFKTKNLYVVSRSGDLGARERSAFAHEFTHALQDQHFDIGQVYGDIVDTDRAMARQALIEGDATFVQTRWMLTNLTTREASELGALATAQLDPALLDKVPPILRAASIFPYVQGLQFVLALQASGGWTAVDAAFARPPDSTEQILHPDKYRRNEGPVTVAPAGRIADRMGTGWRVRLEDSMGELRLRVWLQEVAGLSESEAIEGATGWGGDRVLLLEGPSKAWGVLLRTVWDADADASEFANGAYGAQTVLPFAHVLAEPGSDSVVVTVASDLATLASLEKAER